jgi:hypothetical protein
MKDDKNYESNYESICLITDDEKRELEKMFSKKNKKRTKGKKRSKPDWLLKLKDMIKKDDDIEQAVAEFKEFQQKIQSEIEYKEVDDQKAAKIIEEYQKQFYPQKPSFLKRICIGIAGIAFSLAIGLGIYSMLKKSPIVYEQQTNEQIEVLEIEQIKNIQKRIWLDNGTPEPDGNELELKILNGKWSIKGMKNVNKDNLYLLLTFEDGQKEVLKFENGLAKGYIKGSAPEQNIKFAEVVELNGNNLIVHATYKKQSKGKSESKNINKTKFDWLFPWLPSASLKKAYEKTNFFQNFDKILNIYFNSSVDDAIEAVYEIFGYKISKKKFYTMLDKWAGGVRKRYN